MVEGVLERTRAVAEFVSGEARGGAGIEAVQDEAGEANDAVVGIPGLLAEGAVACESAARILGDDDDPAIEERVVDERVEGMDEIRHDGRRLLLVRRPELAERVVVADGDPARDAAREPGAAVRGFADVAGERRRVRLVEQDGRDLRGRSGLGEIVREVDQGKERSLGAEHVGGRYGGRAHRREHGAAGEHRDRRSTDCPARGRQIVPKPATAPITPIRTTEILAKRIAERVPTSAPPGRGEQRGHQHADRRRLEARHGLGRPDLGERVDDAIEQLRQAIDADPEDPAAYEAFGDLLVDQGRLEEAASNYRQLSRIRPGAPADKKLADVLARLGRGDTAR